MNQRENGKLHYKGTVNSSKHVRLFREKVQSFANQLLIPKMHLTVITTAASDVCRIFLTKFEEFKTEVSELNGAGNTGISIRLTANKAKPTNAGKQADLVNLEKKLYAKLRKVEKVFTHFELSLDSSDSFILILEYSKKADKSHRR